MPDIIDYPEILRLDPNGLAQWMQEQNPPEDRTELNYHALRLAADVLAGSDEWHVVRALAEYGHDTLHALAQVTPPPEVFEPEPAPEEENPTPEPEPEPIPPEEQEVAPVGAA